MTALKLNIQDRKQLRADAHHLNPVVMIGNDGLTDAVKREVNNALNAHGLIKVRVQSDDRHSREAMLVELSEEFNAAPIQHIGKLLILWREKLVVEKEVNEDRMRGPRDMKVMKYSKRGGQRPEVRTLRVLGNERLTFGGKVKRVQPKQKSVKKTQLG
jgi:putative YhbY family RNA-binding protein